MSKLKEKIPLGQALAWILLSAFVISGSISLLFFYFSNFFDKKKQDDAYAIVAIVQQGHKGERLKTTYLAELLNLSLDRPTNLYAFNVKAGEDLLNAVPLIKEASIIKIAPGTIGVDYQMRLPLAFLGDFHNAAIDADGYLFPLKPFYTPKKLPKFFLGSHPQSFDKLDEPLAWGSCLKGTSLSLALEIKKLIDVHFEGDSFYLSCIDLTKAFAESFGQRQIVVAIEERSPKSEQGTRQRRILRLSPHNYADQLGNYMALHRHLNDDKKWTEEQSPVIAIDLRLSDLAFISLHHLTSFETEIPCLCLCPCP